MDFDYSNLYTAILGGLTVAILTGFFATIIRVLKKIRENKEWKESEISNKLVSELNEDRLELITSSKFIPTMGQKIGPHNNENIIEPDESRYPLAENLLKEILTQNTTIGKKRYVILGGSGMGKSTFSASLFYKYTYRYKFKKSPWPIYVKYLGKKNVLKEIQNIDAPNISQSIIILDALDENLEATKDLKGIMDKIEELTDKFKFVILSSRTQLFPNELCEPHRGSVIQNGGTRKLLTWEKIYISPFSKEETKMFLENKYQIGSKQYQESIRIMENTKDLMTRPLVLSFIDDLLEFADRKDLTTVEIYAKIIDEWLRRECEGLSVSKSDLYIFSKKLSLFIYEKWVHSGEASLSEDEYLKFVKENGYNSSPYSFKERSLINRKGDGAIKFSHKSFWEFFIAINSMENPCKSFNSQGLEMAVVFFKEMYELFLKGTTLECVDYYDPQFIVGKSFLDPILIDAFTRCKEIKSFAYSKEALYEFVYNIRIMLLQRLVYQRFSSMSIIAELAKEALLADASGDKLRAIKIKHQAEKGATILENQNAILSDLQECFIDTNTDQCYDILSIVVNRFESIIEWMTEAKEHTMTSKNYALELSEISNQRKELIVFPSLFKFSKDFVEGVLSNSYINIGYGLNGDNEVYRAIASLLTLKPGLDTISIYKEGENIEAHVNFIKNLTEYIPKRPTQIIVKLVFDDIPIFYVVDKKSETYNEQMMKLCISNMLKVVNIND